MLIKIWDRRTSGPVPMSDDVRIDDFVEWLHDHADRLTDVVFGGGIGGLAPAGGHVRFPGSDVQDFEFHWRVVRGNVKRNPGPTNRGELFVGRGDTQIEAAIDGLVTAFELMKMRSKDR